jgi:8-oxo-dGTP diphosphatase
MPEHVYVVGFLIDAQRERVALVRKNRPAWQNGRFNGVGGKVEASETPLEAMIREFREEAGADIRAWEPIATVRGPEVRVDAYRGTDTRVHYFRAFTDGDLDALVSTQTDEPIVVMPIAEVSLHNAVPNATWLIPLALSVGHDTTAQFAITEIARV